MEDELKTNAVKLRPEEQYQIRKSIVRLSKLGKKNGEIAEILDVSERHVRSIKNQYAEGGLAAIVPPIKPCQNQAAYFVKGALKKEAILEWFNCKDFKCERTLCSSSSFDCADALLPTERFKSLFTSSSGLYSGA